MKFVKDFPRQVQEIENLWIPLPDGTRLAARAWMPVDAAEASSSVLTTVAPIVLPPSTAPTKTAPGDTMTRSA